MKKRKLRMRYPLALLGLCLSLGGCLAQDGPALPTKEPDLVVFTCQEDAVYMPILTEYRERTNLTIRVIHGTYPELEELIRTGTLDAECDIVFGVNAATLERTPDSWEAYTSPQAQYLSPDFYAADGLWTGFRVRPLVIMYNTKVVTYRELPEGWKSLLEPRWKGRIAFADPNLSDTCCEALNAAVRSAESSSPYLEAFLDNLEYSTFENLDAVNHTITEGRCFLGVTLEESAESLRQGGADVDYIYPGEGTGILIDSTAIVAGCRRPEAARDFVDFTVSKDVQHYLSTVIHRRPVRTDAPAPPNLSGLHQLPILSADAGELAEQYRRLLEEWNRLLGQHAEEGR